MATLGVKGLMLLTVLVTGLKQTVDIEQSHIHTIVWMTD